MVSNTQVFDGKWETIPFSKYFTLLPTNTYSREQLSDNGIIGNVHYGDILTQYGCVLSEDNYIPRLRDTSKLNEKQYLKKNDVIIADTAEDETVGKAVQIGEINMPMVSGLHTMACRPNYQTADRFLGFYINSDAFHNQLLPYITGIKVSSVSKKSIGKTILYIPAETAEQQAIASALSDFDEHIDNLTELIGKKKAIRDGALEDLVSGKTRIDGFDSEWTESTIGDITKAIITGGTPSTSIDKYWGGSIPWLASTEIHQKAITKPTKGITNIGLNNSSAKIVPKESVLIALAGQGKTRGTAGFLVYPMAINQSLAALVALEGTDSKFLFYLVDGMYLCLRELSSGDGGRGGLSKKLLKNISVWIPSDKNEQQAIAEVLTAMDEEIEALEEEKSKLMQIREGAMDDLLTGRVRLKV